MFGAKVESEAHPQVLKSLPTRISIGPVIVCKTVLLKSFIRTILALLYKSFQPSLRENIA